MNTNWLYTMRTGFILLISVSVWFVLGIIINNMEVGKAAFRVLNNTPFMQWPNFLINAPLISFWLLGLFILVILLGLNTALCSWRDLLPVWKQKRWGSSRIVLFPIHVLTLVVFLLHGVDLVFVHEDENVQLYQGQSFQAGEYTIKVDKISYQDDKSLIVENAQGKSEAGPLTRRRIQDFDPRKNIVHLIVTKEGKAINGTVGFMRPYEIGSSYIFITDFRIVYKHEQQGIQANMKVIYNPFVTCFFTCYLLLLASLLYQAFFYWQRKCRKGSNK